MTARTAGDRALLARVHVPNTPRQHDGNGKRLNEPVQCRSCLQAWPCETRELLDLLNEVRAAVLR